MKYKNKDELQQEVQKRGRHMKMGRKALTQHSKPIRSCWFLCKRETKTEERTEEKQKCVLHLLKSETTKDNGAVESGRESGKVCVCVCMRLYTVHSFNM